MVTKKPRIVIIGAGMAGLTAANKLHTCANSDQLFDLCVVEGGTRIGGRVNSFEFCGERVEKGATWIHGIEGSPVFKIAQETNLLDSDQPWECMDGIPEDRLTIAEGGHVLHPFLVEPISTLFKNLMDFIQGEAVVDDDDGFCSKILNQFNNENISVGSFLRKGLEAYWGRNGQTDEIKKIGNWDRKSLEEAIFAMNESVQRTFTSADDLCNLDYNAESEYVMFPGEEITIAKGYSSVIEHLASVLPVGMIQFGRRVTKIEWQSDEYQLETESGDNSIRPVKLHFCDGSTTSADHVIVTVSLGVLKNGIQQDSNMFNPPLPSSKALAISRLGYGVVNKVFLRLSNESFEIFPFLQMAFHRTGSVQKDTNIPEWIRRTSFISPIYINSRVVVSWFTGQEALELESLPEEEIINGFTRTVSKFLQSNSKFQPNPYSNGTENGGELVSDEKKFTFAKVSRTQWGSNPLFFGSYSYIAVGSSPEDMDTLSEPLPRNSRNLDSSSSPPPPLQVLFAGEATHRTHYSTTHGAYFSGLREANRLLKHYNSSVGT